MFFRPRAVLLMSLLTTLSLSLPASGADLHMKVTDNGYLRGRGVSVMLYDDTYSPIFFDQKDSAMQIILHGHRIATNGSVRLSPTPEQWSLIPHVDAHQADAATDSLTARMSYPAYHLSYQVVVTAEPGGFRVSVNLDHPLPANLVGRAGFNLEFLPSIYENKSYVVDDSTYGVMPQYPESQMTTDPPKADDPKPVWYITQWRKARKYIVPLPFASGQSITLAAGDPLNRISVTSDSGKISLYDGRNQGQNGWFVMRTMIPAGKTNGAVVWHVRPSYLPNWTRPPMIAHSQAGYAAGFSKVAVIELDPNFDAPRTAQLLRLSDDGTYKKVYEAQVSAPMPWLRYHYVKFDFSSVKQPGLYKIEYAGEKTAVFPIAKNIYDNTWQTSLDCFMAEQMDHIRVRDVYHVWHGLAHMDDAEQAPPNIKEFDGYFMTSKLYSPYKAGQHIPGLNIGGWFDAGDFDSDVFDQLGTVRTMALIETTFHPKWDELTVDETTRNVVMHQPDGIPDVVEQVEHGVLQTLAQVHAVGHPLMGIHSSNLEEYTFVGDGASQSDGRIYDPKLGPNQIKGDYSGKNDDRWAWTNDNIFADYSAVATLAAASEALKGWNDPLAKQSLDAAIKLWKTEQGRPMPPVAARFKRFMGAMDWSADLELLIATNGAQPYKQRVEQLFPQMMQNMGFQGWTAVRALPYLDASYKAQFRKALEAYMPQMNREMAATPFGVPPTRGAWGGSGQVAEFGIQMYFLHEAFPDLVGPEYTLRAANYLLGTHPASNVSYIAGIGTQSKPKTYSNNRGDNSYIPGGMIPGYIVINPDFPECITNFGMLWYEDETTIGAATDWIMEANAAEAIVKQQMAQQTAGQKTGE